MSSEATQKIKVRIQALLAKAKGTDNEHEAELFLSKAMDLMQQYQLDIADMVDAGDPILHHVGLSAAESGHAWRWKLYSAVARLYGCKSIHVQVGDRAPKPGKRPTAWYEQRLVGRESAIITTDLMYPWIVEQVRAHAKAIAEQTGMSGQGQAKRVAAALISRINGLVEAPSATTAAGKNALLVLDQVTAKYDDLYPKTELIKARGARTDALSRDAANSIGLHRQTGGASQLKLGN